MSWSGWSGEDGAKRRPQPEPRRRSRRFKKNPEKKSLTRSGQHGANTRHAPPRAVRTQASTLAGCEVRGIDASEVVIDRLRIAEA